MTQDENTSTVSDSPIAPGARVGLSLPIELEEGAPPAIFRRALTILSLLVLALIGWSTFAKVNEMSVAPGAIMPSEDIRQVAHLEGGIVEKIFVKEGASVEAGQELISLRPESADASFGQISARQADLRIRAERLAAQAAGRTPDFSPFRSEWPTLVEEQTAIFRAAETQHQSELSSLNEKIIGAEADVTASQIAEEDAREQLDLAQEKLQIQADLIEEGFTSKQAHLEAKSALATARTNAATAIAQLEQSQRAFNAAQADLEKIKAAYRNQAAEQRAAAIAELLEIERRAIVSADKDDRLTLRAPVSGIINHLAVNGSGDVLRPGDVAVEIVPISARMVADVRVLPKDIGHVIEGQEAEITVSTFDPKSYGTLSGKITYVSADSFVDERTGESYFQVKIDPEDSIDNQRLFTRLSPGMEVSVQIITEKRSLAAYMLKPVIRGLDGAFNER